MRRILVTGITGAGKTTLARAVAGRLGIPFHEMDALALTGPGWAENPRLAEDVAAISAGPGWVFDSLGYPQVRDPLWTRADGIVWLDYPRWVVMARVLRRSVKRTVLRRPVFGGNVETVGLWFTRDHPAWWAWTQYGARRAEIAERIERFGPLEVARLGSPRAARDWLAALKPEHSGERAQD
ncbi:MAG TPA: AAA family ATPase [Streptosporangiaceae bacterium]